MADQTDLDPVLLASLELFNEHLEQTAEEEKATRAVAKAERRKDEAAARVRKLNDNPKATAEEKAEAEAAYREAVAEVAARTDDPLGTGAAAPSPEPDAEGQTTESGSAEGGEETESAEGPEPVAEGETGSDSAADGEDNESDSAAGGEDAS